MTLRAYVLALAAGLALADASIVTLALPTSSASSTRRSRASPRSSASTPWSSRRADAARAGASALLGARASAPAASRSSRWPAPRAPAPTTSPACSSARCAQALGGAAGLATVFELLGGAGPGRRLWLGAAVLATAIGPALGGALTEAFDWRAIFVFQAPIAAAGASPRSLGPRMRRAPPAPGAPRALRAAAGARARARLRGAGAVLFLLVLLLVAGWNVCPLSAAAAVTVIPLGGARRRARARRPARARGGGCALVGGGVLALAWLPDASLWWTVSRRRSPASAWAWRSRRWAASCCPSARRTTPRGCSPCATPASPSRSSSLAPIVAHQLDVATQRASERGVALVLDAPLAPAGEDQARPGAARRRRRPTSRATGCGARSPPSASASAARDLAAYDQPRPARRRHARRRGRRGVPLAFLIAGAPAARRGAARRAGAPRRAHGRAPARVARRHARRPTPRCTTRSRPRRVAILDPCTAKRSCRARAASAASSRTRRSGCSTRTACKLGSSREELVLALADKDEAKRFEREHGVDPRTAAGCCSCSSSEAERQEECQSAEYRR